MDPILGLITRLSPTCVVWLWTWTEANNLILRNFEVLLLTHNAVSMNAPLHLKLDTHNERRQRVSTLVWVCDDARKSTKRHVASNHLGDEISSFTKRIYSYRVIWIATVSIPMIKRSTTYSIIKSILVCLSQTDPKRTTINLCFQESKARGA